MTARHYTRTVDAALEQLDQLAGRFVVFEGADGSGKTTQLARLLAACAQRNLPTTNVREPGGTPVGEKVREILLSKRTTGLSMSAEMLLYMAARAELVATVIRPALARGELVLADRFIPSTVAYQGDAGGLAPDEIARVGQIATGGLEPDLILLLDVDDETASKRMGADLDRIESRGRVFRQAVRQSYLDQADTHRDSWRIVDGGADPDAVWSRVLVEITGWLSGEAS